MKNKDDDKLRKNILEIIRARRSIRAFLPKPVSSDMVYHILEVARFAPSGVNTQPWKVAIVGSHHRAKLSQAIIKARENHIPPNPDYDYYPSQWQEPYKSRRKACGLALYGALNIALHETEKRKEQWHRNYYFFNAPVALIFYMPSFLATGAWIDMGMFMQNIMLAARHFGLETCPQAALAEYPDIVRAQLGIVDHHIIAGMAMGYADEAHPVNQYRTEREPVETFSMWLD